MTFRLLSPEELKFPLARRKRSHEKKLREAGWSKRLAKAEAARLFNTRVRS